MRELRLFNQLKSFVSNSSSVSRSITYNPTKPISLISDPLTGRLSLVVQHLVSAYLVLEEGRRSTRFSFLSALLPHPQDLLHVLHDPPLLMMLE